MRITIYKLYIIYTYILITYLIIINYLDFAFVSISSTVRLAYYYFNKFICTRKMIMTSM